MRQALTTTAALAAIPAASIAMLAAGLFAMLARALITRGARTPAHPPAPSLLEGAAGVEEKLAALVRRPTVSRIEASKEDDEAFAGLVGDLPGLFPRAHEALQRIEVGDRALVYLWRGTEDGLLPAMLCAHFDVVAAEDAAEWKHGPFSGDIEGGCVWGRGTQDIKVTMACILNSVERLSAEGFRPRRTLILAFGGDEEVGGNRGARAIARHLASLDLRPSFILDEGGVVADGLLPFADRHLALVGVAEKGYIDVAVETRGTGGHASMPPRRSATGQLARAVAAIEDRPSRTRLTWTVRSFLERLSPYAPFAYRFLFRNLWAFSPAVRAAFATAPTTNALVRTTAAPTMLAGSEGANVLADAARAIVNCRILPGDSTAALLGRLAEVVRPFGAAVSAAYPEGVVEPSAESPIDHEGYRAVEAALVAAFPEAAALPYLVCAGTDTKHYRELTCAIYRLTPLRQSQADIARIHGRDERVEIGDLRRCALFYKSLIASL
jgi:carboxypeptidase PM20D1